MFWSNSTSDKELIREYSATIRAQLKATARMQEFIDVLTEKIELLTEENQKLKERK